MFFNDDITYVYEKYLLEFREGRKIFDNDKSNNGIVEKNF